MNYVRNAWYAASWSHELPAGKPVPMSILNEPIALYRTDDGRVVALQDRCVHRSAPLSIGRCEGANLRCMYHGILFDPGGKAIEIPGQNLIPQSARVKSYPASDKHGWVWVWMGEPSLADEALIPALYGTTDPNWTTAAISKEYNAAAQLVYDNLLDLSHVSYVHLGSFGAPEHWDEEQMKPTVMERSIRFERWLPNSRVPGYVAEEAYADNFITYDFGISGTFELWNGSFPVGTAASLDMGRPDLTAASGFVNMTTQAVTPMTDRTTRHFFAVGVPRGPGDQEPLESFFEVTKLAFAEDKAIIEAQQATMDRTPDVRIMPISHDRGVTLYNRLAQRLLKAERQVSPVAA